MPQSKGLAIFFIILALVLAATGGLFLWLQGQRVLSPSELSNVTEDETANWQTYRNEQYGFEFKHPLDLGNPQEIEPVIWGYGNNNPIHDFAVYLRSDNLHLDLGIFTQVTSREVSKVNYNYPPVYSSEQWDFEKEFLSASEIGAECSFLWASRFDTIDNECRVLDINGTKMIARVLWWPTGDVTGMSYAFYNNQSRYDFYVFSDELMTPGLDDFSTDLNTQVRLLTLEEIEKLPSNSAVKLGQQILSTFQFIE